VNLILRGPREAMAEHLAEPVRYSVVLRPHRSASVGAVRTVVCLVAVAWLVVGLVFVAVGAWPVAPFLGLEILLLYGAFRLNAHAGNALEAINLTDTALTVRRVDFWGKQKNFSFPPNWLQVNFDEPPSNRSLLELRSHGDSLIIGTFLRPRERLELARILRRELTRLTASRKVG
jgi:uncharacterized membrane protein